MSSLKKAAAVFLAIALILSTFAIFPATVSAATSVVVDPGIEFQTMDGWGTSLAWFANIIGGWSDTNRHAVEDLIFGPDGLDFNIVRYNIGGSGAGDPQKDKLRLGGYVESYMNPDGTYDWDNRDKNQRLVLQEAIARGVNIKEAFSNSPPYWMTNSGTVSGSTDGSSNNLKEDQYEEFADYLTEVVKHFRDSWGITFDTLTPLNEPHANWWKAGGNQEGCHFDRDKQAQIISEVYNKLVAKNLTGTAISAPEENSIDESVDSVNSYGSDVLEKIGCINTHSYNGAKRVQIHDLAESLDKPLWMSEFGTSGGSPHDHDSISSGLLMADTIFKDIKDMQAEAWIDWQVVEDEAGMLSIDQNWGPIHADLSGSIAGGEEEFWLTKQYYVIKQFSKFIPQGYTIIDANSQNVIAAYNKSADTGSRKLVLVARNTTSKDSCITFDLTRFNSTGTVVNRYRTSSTENCEQLGTLNVAGGRFTDTIPANSIVTYVIDSPEYDGGTGRYINDGAAGTADNLFNYSGSWGYCDQNGAYGNDNHYSNTKDDYYQVSFYGNKVQVFAARDTNAGIAGISIDGGPETLVDCYSAGRKDQSLIFTGSGLANGEHTLKVRVTGEKNASSTNCYINADKVFVVNNDQGGTPAYIPVIYSLIPGDGILVLNYSSVADSTHENVKYNIKYGTSSGNYTEEISDVTGTSIKIGGLQNGTTYYVAVSSLIYDSDTQTWIESANSYEMSETPAASENTSLMYYVNCGDSSPASTESGETLGKYNGKEDQEYGMDEVTGYNWGYVADGNLTWSQDSQSIAGNSNYDCLRQYDGKETAAGGGLTYKFEIPDGKYDVTLGFKDPWNNSNRKENIIIEGVIKTTALVPGDAGIYKSYGQIEVNDGELDVRIQKNAEGSGNNPMISWIKVETAIATAPQAPSIDSISTGNDFMNVKFNESKGATGYKIKYGTSSGSYTKTIEDVAQSPYQITGLASGVKYYVVVTAINSYGESGNSDEKSATTASSGNVLYYVDCGDGSVNSLEPGEVLGARNSNEEQEYGVDSVTGFSWGYEADDNSTWAGTDTSKYDSSVNYNTIRQYNGGKAGKGLNYRFQVPDGHYTVTLGFMDPWNNSGRKENIIINGETKETDYVPTNNPNTKTYTGVSADNGELTVRVERSSSAKDNPIISWIKVEHNLVYYVDCGDGSVDTVEPNEMLGERNSVEDQEYGVDPKTGYRWGYTADDNKVWRKTDGSTNYDTLIQYDGNKVNGRIVEGKGITYSFEVENGTYDVAMGFMDPWWQTGWEGRKETISIEGAVKESGFIPTTTPVSLSYQNICVTDGVLEIKVAASANAWDKPFVNWIRIEKAAAGVPGAPVINDVIAGNGYLRVKYTGGAGAAYHRIKYGTSSGGHPNTVDNVSGGIGTITGLTNGTPYYIVLTAVNETGESAESNEVSSTPVALTYSNLLYYVDCGDSDVYKTEEGESFGTRNTIEDQEYGVDQVTGYRWGYTADDNKVWRKTDGSSNYDTLIQYDGDKVNDRIVEGKGITYRFEVPNGAYDVEIGFMDPWWQTGWEGRKETISIEGAVKKSGYIPTSTPEALSYENIGVTDGFLEIKVAASANAWDKPLVNWIKVKSCSAPEGPVDNGGGSDGSSGNGGNDSSSGSDYSNKGGVKDKTPIKVEIQAPALENKTAIVSVDADKLKNALEKSEYVLLEIPKVAGATAYAVNLPAAALSSKDTAQISINTEFGIIVAPTNMLNADEVKDSQDLRLQISKVNVSELGSALRKEVGNKPVIEIRLEANGLAMNWNNPDAPVTISVPYAPTAEELSDPAHIVIWNIDGSGKITPVPNGRYDKAAGVVTFKTTHFNKYAIAYVYKTFGDIAGYGWAKNAIEVLASRGVTSGTSSTAYSPGAAIKRADFIVMLVRALGLSSKVESNFSDVKASDYYYEAVGTARKLGITEGIGGNKFTPNEAITRQDMMVLILNAMNAAGRNLVAGSSADLNKYNDKGKISAYAMQSISTLVKNNIVSGDSANNINPLRKATRAETAVLIRRITDK